MVDEARDEQPVVTAVNSLGGVYSGFRVDLWLSTSTTAAFAQGNAKAPAEAGAFAERC